jgi:hypothetical protein
MDADVGEHGRRGLHRHRDGVDSKLRDWQPPDDDHSRSRRANLRQHLQRQEWNENAGDTL